MGEKLKIDLYNDVVTHVAYDTLTNGLNDEEKVELNKVLREFTTLLETGMLRPGYDMVEKARDAVAEEMVADAIKRTVQEGHHESQSDTSGTVEPAAQEAPVTTPEEGPDVS